MYKILALNCLITAYSLSVQYLDGVKFGDYQVTISGMLMSVCFLCISRAKVCSLHFDRCLSLDAYADVSLWRNSLKSDRLETSSTSTFCSQSSSSSLFISFPWYTSLSCHISLNREYRYRLSHDGNWQVNRQEGPIDLDAKFEPNLLNTAIYLLGLSQQVSTFAINFQVCFRVLVLCIGTQICSCFRDDLSERVSAKTRL